MLTTSTAATTSEFQFLSRQDIALVAKEVMDIEVTDEVVEKIDFNSGGNLRKAMKVMYIIESICQACPDADISGIDFGRTI